VLALQDRRGACVMLVLCLCWRAARGAADDAAVVAALEARGALLERQSLVPLRAARRVLAQAGGTFAHAGLAAASRRVLASELALERVQAARLAGAVPLVAQGGGAPVERAAHALALYFAARGQRGRGARVAGVLARLVLAC
jgi:uncharacterized protein (TIGR02444 family)